MNYFPDQSVIDLEFDLIRLMLHDNCISSSAQMKMVDLAPSSNIETIKDQLNRVNDLLSIRLEGITFPHIEFEELDEEIELLKNKHNTLNEESFLKIKLVSDLANSTCLFFDTHEGKFEHLKDILGEVYHTSEILKAINKVFDSRGNVKDDASPELYKIRLDQKTVRKKINVNFSKQLKELGQKGHLSDSNETFLYGKRLLAVKSSYKRSVNGNAIGSSKTGNITFIEPKANIPLNHELEMLRDDERTEIFKILKDLTGVIRSFLHLIIEYQKFIIELDFVNAKCKLAKDLNCSLPQLVDSSETNLIEAYHPILLISNRSNGVKTIPQSILLDKFNRMIVISGPNAGGKSITLKTVGILQIMIQSGILIPVNPDSKIGIFKSILTDIGDNQSIENQLSTYSYRLKRMKEFLENANKRTLILLDEFGTGSDPELGGAMAEVFFEELYNKKSFGVITTHYGNIKIKADRLQNAVNCCMLFNQETLEPTFKLSIGMPGSSFTFEVAEKNGIPKKLIDKAKEKLDRKKVDMDKLLSALQKEKADFERLTKEAESRIEMATNAEQKFKAKEQGFKAKSETQRDLAQSNSDFISKGKKLSGFIAKYDTRGKNKELLADVRKYLAIEKTKIIDAAKAEKLRKKAQAKKDAKKNIIRHTDNQKKITVGSQVKIIGAKKIGEVIEKDGNDVVVLFGNLKTKLSVQKLRFIK